ncbi:MAG TPA: DNA gyrase C-terminal beta-propeller domain-containing protein, partial [Gemmataceae bacterium]|nr:DNA gyrase C-terminal beta-propeller domain-containing protein [Gemmataceae bacterium]
QIILFADDGTAYTMRINEVPATTGYGEPVTKYFKFADGVRVVSVISTDVRFTPADQPGKGETPGGPYLLVATSAGSVLRLPLAAFRTESTKSGRRFVKLDDGDKVVMVRLVGDETGVMLASSGGHVIHFPVDDVSVLSGPGKGVIGIKIDDEVCVGGMLVGGRFDKLVVETEKGTTQEFGPGAIKVGSRARVGEKPRERTRFSRVAAPPIELVNWDEVDGKAPKKDAEKNGDGQGTLFDG